MLFGRFGFLGVGVQRRCLNGLKRESRFGLMVCLVMQRLAMRMCVLRASMAKEREERGG